MTTWDIDSVATELLACEAERRERVKFTDEWPELDVATGYAIQDETLRRRLEPVSYTHLDVYKRQSPRRRRTSGTS